MAEFQFAGSSTPFRLTAVMHREQGKWKIIQLHFSIGVPNSQLPI
jgi:ketosteroid isomerase-like protein